MRRRYPAQSFAVGRHIARRRSAEAAQRTREQRLSARHRRRQGDLDAGGTCTESSVDLLQVLNPVRDLRGLHAFLPQAPILVPP